MSCERGLGLDAETFCEFCQLVGNRSPAFVETHILMGLAVRLIAVKSDHFVSRFAAPFVGEGCDCSKWEGFAAFFLVKVIGPEVGTKSARPGKSFFRDDLEHASHAILSETVRPFHVEPEDSTRSKVKLCLRDLVRLGREPLFDMFRIGVRFPNKLDRSVKSTFQPKICLPSH